MCCLGPQIDTAHPLHWETTVQTLNQKTGNTVASRMHSTATLVNIQGQHGCWFPAPELAYRKQSVMLTLSGLLGL